MEEDKKQCWLAGPIMAVNLLQFGLPIVSVMLVGHLGELSLSSASIATRKFLWPCCADGNGKYIGDPMWTGLWGKAIPSAWDSCAESLIKDISKTIFNQKNSQCLHCSTRVSNELGAGRSHAARLAVYVVFFIAITEAIMIVCLLFSIRYVWGYAYSNEKEVVDYIASMIPLVAASSFLDGIQCILSGIARGCGWQKVGAYVNLGAYYMVGIPIAFFLAFVLQLGGRGLWLGIICGLSVQSILLFLVTTCTGWEQQARNARDRVFASSLPIVTDDLIKDDKN